MKKFSPDEKPPVGKNQCFVRNGCRLSVLTDRLLRIEVQNSSVFCDSPTQAVVNRSFCKTDCTFTCSDAEVIVKTKSTEFVFNLKTRRLTAITLGDGRTVTDFTRGNLGGTGRTLDNTNGFCRLCDGVLSKNGAAVFDDSDSLILTSDGHFARRRCKESDKYYFAYGFDYNEAVHDYFCLTGFPPLIPRFALGNWWSRYKAYTQDEYEALMNRFIKEKIPLTVATVDMDWHWVDVEKKFGANAKKIYDKNNIMEKVYSVLFPGWTGYSWNTDLFPEPEKFLDFLHKKNLKVTMNLHPAAGCRFFERAYGDFCRFMEIDPDSEEVIRFDLSNDKFIEGYFEILHRPHEESGVDFWWIDWQQGKNSDVDGLDPLAALNRYHYIDNNRGGKRGLILSRFSGPGAHRYPIGFSGDTFMTWASLDFQPFFTATASNIGYTWWSHDIGGHTFGVRDDELYLRWIQFGVFSPIMRLHSTSNEFMGKEPWMYRSDVCDYATRALRLRHRLIPYIYTANRRTYEDGIPLIRPMYYAYPHKKDAYEVKNQYFFGSEITVCPITSKIDERYALASTQAYIPGGRWTDIFTGRIYNGDMKLKLFRDEKSIPVLAKEGAIIPLYPESIGNSTDNPSSLELWIYRGSGSFDLYEDDGETYDFLDGKFCTTRFAIEESENICEFDISPANGDISVIPQKRTFILSFRDIVNADAIEMYKNSRMIKFQAETNSGCLRVYVPEISPEDAVKVRLTGTNVLKNPSQRELRTALFSRIKGSNDIKKLCFESFAVKNKKTYIPHWLRDALNEIESLG